MKDKYGEEKVFQYLKDVEVERFKRYYRTFATQLAGIVEKVLPAQIFEKKMMEIVKEFQFFLGIGNIEIMELNSEKAIAKIKQCPYAKANADGPVDLKVPREIYCKFQCNGYIKDIADQAMNLNISFEPKEVECVYTISRK